MKISVCTIPGRPEPTHSPPFGSLTIIQSLQSVGYEPDFYNIDYFRPKDSEMKKYYSDNQFDMVGISAVVSTSYNLVKKLIAIIKEVSPKTTIVVGGNMAASAEVLLRKANADLCVLGDGEVTVNMVASQISKNPKDFDAFKLIKGLSFIDEKDEFCFTGYQDKIPAEDISWPDFSILEKDGSLHHYLQFEPEWYSSKGMEAPKEWVGKRDAVIVTTKGCVARCTFCHRFEKGYRMRPMDQVVEHVKFLKEKYNVGFIQLFDENFGSNIQLTHDIVSEFGKLNIKWRAGGVRARTVTPEMLKHWKENGCDYIAYGIESGSQTMLDVMEKNTKTEANLNAIKWTYEAGISTNIQLVLAMPGENDQTVKETISFLKACTPYISDHYRFDGSHSPSITYAQALPGTPLYEYYRQKGYIGSSLEDEEDYLLFVSDTNASDISHYINSCELPMLKVLSWRHRIFAEINRDYWYKIHGISFSFASVISNFIIGSFRALISKLLPSLKSYQTPLEKKIINQLNGKNNLKLKENITPYRLLFLNKYSYKFVLIFYGLFMAVKKGKEKKYGAIKYIMEYILFYIKSLIGSKLKDSPKKSLRKIVNSSDLIVGDSSPLMYDIRQGR